MLGSIKCHIRSQSLAVYVIISFFMSFPLQHIFLMEQKEYKEEGITWETITYKDNKPILVCLFKPVLTLRDYCALDYFQLVFSLFVLQFSFSLTPKITLSSAFGRRPCGKSQTQEVLTKQDT